MGQLKIKGEPNVLKIGTLEMNRLQTILFDTNNAVVKNFIREFGFAIRVVNARSTDPAVKYSSGFKPSYTAGTLNVLIDAGDAILKAPGAKVYGVSNPSQKTLTITNVNGTYKILLRYKAVPFEKGTITINNGSKNIVGAGTEFTKIFGSHRTIIPLDADGVPLASTYEIDSVTNDGQATLVNNFPEATVTGVKFGTGGYFVSNPASPQDNLIYDYDGFEIIATTGAQGQFDYFIAEVVVSGGVITSLTDARDRNLLRLWGTDADTLRLMYSKSFVELAHTKDVAPTPEEFITNEGKLLTSDAGLPFPLFSPTADTPPEIKLTAFFQDRFAYIVPVSEIATSEILPTGKVRFKVCLSSTGVDDNNPVRCSLEIVPYQTAAAGVSNLPSTGQVSIYIFSNVTIENTAVDEATAEQFETSVDKLAVDINGLPAPEFTAVATIIPLKQQGYEVEIVRGSEQVVNNHMKFKAYVGGVGTPPPSGIYKATFVLIVS